MKVPSTPDFFIARALFLRLLGVVYCIAFVSIWTQIHGLIGSRGILPASEYLDAIHLQLGNSAYPQFPTVCWLGSGDTALTCVCALGTLASVLLVIGIAPIPVLVLLWILYLSLSVVGQTFLSYQWDTLLLETGFLAIFLAPLTMRPRLVFGTLVSRLARWLLWWLLFKLMFLSGMTKLLSGDPTWRDLTAMNFHYLTQPLPNWVSWYAYQLPEWCQKLTVVMTFVVELLVPMLIFAPRTVRHFACVLLAGLQLVIELTGNYGFFNLLTIVLCVPLLDDRLLRRVIPATWLIESSAPPAETHGLGLLRGKNFLLSVILLVSFLTFLREMTQTMHPEKSSVVVVKTLRVCDTLILSWGEPYVLWYTDPFRTINGYGLFRVMTTQRREIVLEASLDGENWVEYEFRYKPGDVKQAPRFVAPHQPRLDWQMWFAALDVRGHVYWLSRFLQRLLEGSPEVTRLLGKAPFSGMPPRYVRMVYYDYEFTNMRQANGDWWKRTRLGSLTGPLSSPARANE